MYPSTMRFPANLSTDFGDLQRQIENIFGAPDLPASIRAIGRGAFPTINIGTTPEALEIYALAPGIDPKKLDLTVDKGLLTISGERESGFSGGNANLNVYAQERFAGSFRRVVNLPENLDISRVDASYRDGVLKIAIPILESAKPRKIDVKSVT